MISPPDRQTSLRSFCETDIHAAAKIGFIALYKIKNSEWSEKLLVIIEYLQLISQSIKYYFDASTSQSYDSSLFFRAIIYFSKLIVPTYLLHFGRSNSVIPALFSIISLLTIFKYLLCACSWYVVFYNIKENRCLDVAIRWVFRIQTRVICFYTTSFFTQLLFHLDALPKNHILGINDTGIAVISLFFIITEYVASFIHLYYFNYRLPTKNFSSSKDFSLAFINLFQKLVGQVFVLCLRKNLQDGIWVICSINIFFCLLRSFYFYRALPRYNFNALFFEGNLISIVNALTFSGLFGLAITSTNSLGEALNDTIIFTVIISILFCMLSHQRIQKLIMRLYMGKVDGPVELLAHRVSAAWQLEALEKLPGSQTSNLHWTNLARSIDFLSLKNNLSDTENSGDNGFLLTEFLKQISRKYPQNTLIKLNAAHVYLKKLKLYAQAIRIITELSNKVWNKNHLTCLFLLKTIEEAIIQKKKSNNQLNPLPTLNLNDYIKSQLLIDELKQGILKQIRLKSKMCQHILSSTPDIGEIDFLARTLEDSKAQTLFKIDSVNSELSENWIEPLLLCAEYYKTFNYASKESYKFHQLMSQRVIKYQKYFDDPNLTEDNLHHNKNAFLLISTGKNSEGKIVHHSKSFQDLYSGKKNKSYHGVHISKVFPQIFHHHYENLIKEIFEKGETPSLNKIQRSFILHETGYLVEVELYIQLHPYILDDLYLDMLVRASYSSKEYLITGKNGILAGMTKTFHDQIDSKTRKDLSSGNLKVASIAPQLSDLDQACNLIQKCQNNFTTDKIRFDDYQTILEQHSLYPLQQEIYFDHQKNAKAYQVSASFLSDHPAHHKLFTLEPAIKASHSANMLRSITKENRKRRRRQVEKPATLNLLESPRRELISPSAANFQTENTERKFLFGGLKSQQNNSVTLEDEEFFVDSSVNTSHFKTEDLQEHNTKIFKLALKTKYYSKSFILLSVFFYLIVLITGISQIILKSVSDNTFQDLQLKKDLLKYAQFRSYYLYKIQFISVGQVLQVEKLLTKEDFGSSFIPIQIMLPSILNYAKLTQDYNQLIITSIDTLDTQIKKELYQNDVRVFGTYRDSESKIYENITNFEMIDKILNSAAYVNTVTDVYSDDCLYALRFLELNVLDDWTVKDNQMRSLFVDSVQNQKEHYQLIIILCLVIIPLLLAGIGFMLVWIIYQQYQAEKSLLLAFLKINHKAVEAILLKLQDLEQCLISDEYLDHQGSTLLTETQLVFSNTSQYDRKQGLQIIKTSALQKRYWNYFFKAFGYLAILLSIIIANFVSAQSSIKTIYKRQDQLEVISSVAPDLCLIYCVSTELITSNNTLPVENAYPLNATAQHLKYLRELPTQLREIFDEVSETQESNIYDILYKNNNCENLSGIYNYYCLLLVQTGMRTDVFSALSYFEQIVIERANLYQSQNFSNMTIGDFVHLSNRNAGNMLQAFEVTVGNSELLVDIVSAKLKQNTDEAQENRSKFLIGFLASLVIVSFLFWFQILKKLGEVNNNFKKVLQVFPSDLILANFVLKTFLQNTSQDGLRILHRYSRKK